jgi:hypothetical protein
MDGDVTPQVAPGLRSRGTAYAWSMKKVLLFLLVAGLIGFVVKQIMENDA